MTAPEILPRTKTARLLKSFQSVELKPEHCNYGDETPCLRDYGISGSTATTLIRWGETECLVCTFENGRGIGPNVYHWKPSFIKAAVQKHIELFGELGKSDLPPAMLALQ
jgi:hypothetical protein